MGRNAARKQHTIKTIKILKSSCAYFLKVYDYIHRASKLKGNQMEKFTTTQLKKAFLELAKRNDEDSNRAYRLCFDVLNNRLGDDKFDEFLDANGI